MDGTSRPRVAIAALILLPLALPDGDSDGDGLSDALERELGSDPLTPDKIVTLRGLALLDDGTPAAGARVRVRGVASGSYEGFVGADGRFALPNWPARVPPHLVLRLFVPGRGLLGAEVDPREGRTPGARTARVGGEPSLDLGKIELAPRPKGALLPGPVRVLPSGSAFIEPDPFDVALGDLDGDGILDQVAAVRDPGSIEVGLGLGDGSFAPGPSYPAGPSPQWLVLGDLDEDGALDVAVSAVNGDSVELRFGGGDGTFGAVQQKTVGGRPREVELADLDRDGHLDLVIASAFTNSIDVLRGNGAGGFAPVVHRPALGQPFSMELGDLDGDGFLDLLTGYSFDGRIAVFRNDGAGRLGAGAVTSVPGFVNDVALGDVDGNGTEDVVLAGNVLQVLRGRGDGTLGASESLPLPDTASAVAVADLDHDGDEDIAAAVADGGTDFDDVHLYRNRGDGTFVHTGFLASAECRGMAVGDLDRDGYLDLCFASEFGAAVSGFLNDRTGGFRTARHMDVFAGRMPVAADLDRDGHQDVVLAMFQGVEILIGDGHGGFRDRGRVGFDEDPWPVVLDLDGDGLLDLVTTSGFSSSRLVVRHGRGDGTFETGTSYPLSDEPLRVDVARVDRDRYPDALVNARDDAAPNTTEVWLLRGGPGGTFGPGVRTGIRGALLALAVGRFDDDGTLDVVAADRFTGETRIYLGTGDGQFRGGTPFVPGPSPFGALIADLDADGHPDLAFACRGNDSVVVYPGAGGGALGAPRSHVVDHLPQLLSAADLDTDGHLDLLVGNGRSLGVLFGRADRTLAAPVAFLLGRGDAGHAVADFDEDGQADVAVGDGGLTLLLGQGTR